LSRRLSLLLLGLAVLASAAALSALAAPPEPPGFQLNGDAKRGKALFAKRCALCHGETGNGQGRMRLKPAPADLTASGIVDKRTDWELYVVIRDGGPTLGLSSTMLAWGKIVPDQEIRDTAAFVRSLAARPDARP
jgi:mono/diheme cytochrome c family protein